MLATQISTRHYLAALALFLLAGFEMRRWWGIFGLLAVTQVINLVWENGPQSPWWSVLPVSVTWATWNAWANLLVLGLATGMFLLPAYGPVLTQKRLEGEGRPLQLWVTRTLALGGILFLLAGVGVFLWRERQAGLVMLNLKTELVNDLQTALQDVTPEEQIIAINCPRVIKAQLPRDLGMMPAPSPCVVINWPSGAQPAPVCIQFTLWQANGPGTQVEFIGDVKYQNEVQALILQADRVLDFHPPTNQVYLLTRRLPATESSDCLAEFGAAVCLIETNLVPRGAEWQLSMDWRMIRPVAPETTVFVHVRAANGDMLSQADGDLAKNMIPLTAWPAGGDVLRETRWLTIPPTDATVWVGIYNRLTGERLPPICAEQAECTESGVRVSEAGSSIAP
jgi:hypothetical protein